MNSSTPNQPSAAAGSSSTAITLAVEGSGKKVRKPYTISKSRESWTEEEHDKFLEALQLFDRDWKKIEDFVGSKTVIQCFVNRISQGRAEFWEAIEGKKLGTYLCIGPPKIRSHAQKYFLKVQKNGTEAHVPPPRPKRKAAHPYPQKASKNVLVPLPVTMAYSSLHSVAHSTWDEASVRLNSASNGFMPPQDENNHSGAEVDAGLKRSTRMSRGTVNGGGSSSNNTSELPKQGKGSILGIPDFSEVYGFIGSVFDPDTNGHAQKLNEMDPINFETVSLLMRNLTMNLSSPNFEPVRKVLSSYDVDTRTVALSVGGMGKKG